MLSGFFFFILLDIVKFPSRKIPKKMFVLLVHFFYINTSKNSLTIEYFVLHVKSILKMRKYFTNLQYFRIAEPHWKISLWSSLKCYRLKELNSYSFQPTRVELTSSQRMPGESTATSNSNRIPSRMNSRLVLHQGDIFRVQARVARPFGVNFARQKLVSYFR